MINTKDNLGIAIVALVISIIVILIFIMVVIIEMDRGIFEHTNQYITETEKINFEKNKLENEFEGKYKEYL